MRAETVSYELEPREPSRSGAPNADGRALGSVSAGVLGQVETPLLLVPPAVWRKYAKEIDYL